MVGRVITEYRPALVRDLLALGFRATDMFTPRLSFYELTCIIIASPPTSSVRYFLDGGWSREAQILANIQEGEAGLSKLSQPYERPGQILHQGSGGGGMFPFQAEEMPIEEMDRRLAERYATARPTPTQGAQALIPRLI
jgi:hypothetical protein